MLSTVQLLIRTLKLLLIVYVALCLFLYFFQEKFIFFPKKLPRDFRFSFREPFKELSIKTKTGHSVNGLLFTAENTKGLIFYLHGNAGAADTWGSVAKTYTDLQYDVFILDYPGYGKSEGSIKSELQLFQSVQAAYDTLQRNYTEKKMIVLGYSIGTGLAAKLAAENNPEMLILQAPYYNLSDIMRRAYPLIPTFLLRYKLKTNEYVRQCSMPVVIFHGDEDEVIYVGSSLKLKKEMKASDTLIILKKQGHNGMTDNTEYRNALGAVLK